MYGRADFVKRYGLWHSGLNPNQVRVPRDITNEEVGSVFGPSENKNGYCYLEYKDEKLIARIENLWMILQQKLVPASHVISLAMARGITIEEKKKMNWAAYGEWTNNEQFRRQLRGRRTQIKGNVENALQEEGFVGDGDVGFGVGEIEVPTDDLQEYKEHVEQLFKDAWLQLNTKKARQDALAVADIVA